MLREVKIDDSTKAWNVQRHGLKGYTQTNKTQTYQQHQMKHLEYHVQYMQKKLGT